MVASAAPREGLFEGLAKTVTEEAVDERVEAGVEVGQSMAHDLHTIFTVSLSVNIVLINSNVSCWRCRRKAERKMFVVYMEYAMNEDNIFVQA